MMPSPWAAGVGYFHRKFYKARSRPLIPKLADSDSCCERPLGHSLQKRTVVQWDKGAVLGRDGGTDESMFPQFGISLQCIAITAEFHVPDNSGFVPYDKR